MERRGIIVTYSVVRSAAEAFTELIPYVVALVEEQGQVRLARVEGYADGDLLEVGREVAFSAEDEKGTPLYRFIAGG